MALSADALTTHDQMELFLDRVGGTGTAETADDDFIDNLINGASRAIKNYCRREFKPVASATRKFMYAGHGVLNLDPYELRAAVTITLYPDLDVSQQTDLTAPSFRLGPLNGTLDGTYLWLEMPKFKYATPFYSFATEVQIAGTWGMSAVPADVEEACWITVAHRFFNSANFASGGAFGQTNTEMFIQGADVPQMQSIPPAARGLLIPYQRRQFVRI